MKSIFTHIYQNNTWNGTESISGTGSTLEQTKHVVHTKPVPKISGERPQIGSSGFLLTFVVGRNHKPNLFPTIFFSLTNHLLDPTDPTTILGGYPAPPPPPTKKKRQSGHLKHHLQTLANNFNQTHPIKNIW